MPEMVLTMGSGGYPQVRKSALPHLDGVAPVLMFGSAFRDTGIYRNILAMLMPVDRHLTCLVEWVMYKGKRVCNALLASRSFSNGLLVFGDEYGLKWADEEGDDDDGYQKLIVSLRCILIVHSYPFDCVSLQHLCLRLHICFISSCDISATTDMEGE
jgi:hypothetical protein